MGSYKMVMIIDNKAIVNIKLTKEMSERELLMEAMDECHTPT